MLAYHASRGERRREFPLLCCLEGTEAARPRVLLLSHEEAVADHVCRSTSGACARTSMFWSETSSTLSSSSAALSRTPAASLGSPVCLANRWGEKIALANRHSLQAPLA